MVLKKSNATTWGNLQKSFSTNFDPNKHSEPNPNQNKDNLGNTEESKRQDPSSDKDSLDNLENTEEATSQDPQIKQRKASEAGRHPRGSQSKQGQSGIYRGVDQAKQ